MFLIRTHVRTLMVTGTLLLGLGTSTSAHALSPGNLGSVGEIWQFVTQLQDWMTSLTDLDKLKDDLFGSVNVNDLSSTLISKLGDYGLGAAGIDIQGIMGKTKEFQNQVNAIRASIMAEVNKVTNLSFLDTAFQAQLGGDVPMAYNPVLDQQRYEGSKGIYEVGEDRQIMTQATADSVKSVEDVKKIVEETGERAKTSNENAKLLTEQAQGIQSTREGMELLIRAQAEAITSSTYNATALTSALAQQVQQTEVTNRTLEVMASEVLDERAARAQSMIGMIRQRQELAQQSRDRLQSTFENAANGIGKSFDVKEADINVADLF